jgi:hypothetical protein
MSHFPRVQAIVGTIAVLAGATAVYAQQPVPTPSCIASPQTFTATGAAQQYVVPAGTSAVYIVANGAAGGDVSGDESHTGGFGAHIAAQVPVTGGTTLVVVVGTRGGDGSRDGAGGGGGTFVFTSAGALLVAAGGGGGAGISGDGYDAQLGANGGNGGNEAYGGAGGTAPNGGAAATSSDENGGGGAGLDGAGGTGVGAESGEGGHRITSPGDAAGGQGDGDGTPGDGGFGGGGGGSDVGGGGGGGYGGGGGGYGDGDDGGGGGGSGVGAGGVISEASVLTAAGDGSVTICVAQQQSEAVPVLSVMSIAALVFLLALLGFAVLSRRH